MPLSTIFQLYHGGQFIGGGNRSTRRNHRPVEVTDKLYHIKLYTSPWTGFELTTSVAPIA